MNPIRVDLEDGDPGAAALIRHFVDLRDGRHGEAVTRQDKETLFARAVVLLEPRARRVLDDVNRQLLLRTGVVGTDAGRTASGDQFAEWTLGWPEQRAVGISPITLRAFYGAGFHHPHLQGATVGEWPLNVFSPADAEATVPTLRAIAAAELHNLVYRSSYLVVPAVTRPELRP